MTTAWIFAGHGAQYPGMGRAVLRETEAGRRWLADAESITGLPLGQYAAVGPRSSLADPRVLEPLLVAVSGTYADLLLAHEGQPAGVAGYSAGHLAALYAAGVVSRETCIDIARIRGAELARAASLVPGAGGMTSVHGLPEEQLVLLADEDTDHPASIAARNAPMHVVYSGTTTAVARASARASDAGAVTAPLDVAGPWHSPWLEPARAAIERGIATLTFSPARVPVWSTVTARPMNDPDELRLGVAASVVRPVEWHATVRAMREAGIDTFVEASPGRSLWALLGQLPPPHGFTRRYLESERGPVWRPSAKSKSPIILGAKEPA